MNLGNAKENRLFVINSNKKYFATADDINPNDKNSSLSYIIKAILENSVVLDVGCSYGYLGEWLIKNKNCQVYGIDIDKEAVAYVKERGYYKDVFNLDLDYPEKTKDEFDRFADLENIFDFVICADVLEHLKQPTGALEFIVSKLKPGGQVLISIPNIAHMDIILNLLEGRFNYSELGILDNTHLRFFTKKSFIEWIKSANEAYKNKGFKLDVRYLGGTIYTSEFLDIVKQKNSALYDMILKGNPDLEILQNIFALTKINNFANTYGLNDLLSTINYPDIFKAISEKIDGKDREIYSKIQKIENLKSEIATLKERYDIEIKNKEYVIENLTKEKDKEIKDLQSALNSKDSYIKDVESKYNEVNNQLTHIYNSHGWKFLLKYYKVRDTILPEGSKRRKIIKVIFKLPRLFNKSNIKKGIAFIKMYGFKAFYKKVRMKFLPTENIKELNIKNENSIYLMSAINYLLPDPYIPHLNIRKPIDILIPVYNSKEFLNNLLKSIVANTFIPYRLLIANDNSSDKSISQYLLDFKNNNQNLDIIILENKENLGFVKTVNELAKLTKNHFVIINTDTEVPPYWLERMIYPIIMKNNIASVTPFTNAGTICSFPNFLADNLIFENMDVATLDSYFQFIDFEKSYIEIPTAVGFCMAINKEVYDKIGLFDEIFGRGYGEENDWSMRALKACYKNIITPNLFVYHKHGASFPSEEKKKLMENNLRLLENKHPNYFLLVEDFIKKDPLKHIRNILKIKVVSSVYRPIMILDHTLGGGANEYTNKFIEDKNFVIIVKYDLKCNKYFVEFLGKKIDMISFEMQDIKEIEKVIIYFNVKDIIINELVSYPKILDLLDFLIELRKNYNKINYIFMGHDYYCICPMYNLLNYEIKYCNVPPDLKLCNKCIRKNYLIKTEVPFIQQDYPNLEISIWRERFGKLLEYCSKIVCFSYTSKEIIQKAYENLSEDIFEIKPHIVDWVRPVVISSKSSNLNIAIIGAIGIPKGADVVISIAEYIKENNLKVKLHIFGEIFDPIEKLKENEYVLQHGRYSKFNLPKLMEDNKIDVVIIPSIWPETFSYTTEEVIKMNLNVAVFDLGAPAERVKQYDKGIILEKKDPEYIIRTIYNYINKNIISSH
ncbi:methyltransferase domain-containing protein [Thermoanaerobacterium saccharolyticum]|uniref:methyltransferase domain-containing protein n=1 Tax=Thermoanaerobacterium saccharolyticum TaxID=28896 RepID=UPI002FD8D184